MCALFCHFSVSIFTKKGYYSRKQGFMSVKHDFRVIAPTSMYGTGGTIRIGREIQGLFLFLKVTKIWAYFNTHTHYFSLD